MLIVGVLAAATACTGKTPDSDASTGTQGFGGPSVATPASGIARDGVFDVNRTNEAKFRVGIDAVVRDANRTVLRLTVTNLESKEQQGIDQFGASSSDQSFVGFRLLDPVGGKLYYGMRLGSEGGPGFGSRLYQIRLQPGVHYSAVVYLPPLPENVTAVTVLTPGTTGEITGVPVRSGSYTATPAATGGAEQSKQIIAINSPRPPGASVEIPPVEPSGDAWSLVADVSGLVVTPEGETTASPVQRSVALRSDILFDFGSSALTARAKTLITQAANEIAGGGDPGRPITVVGHTDGIGSASDNQKLSERRADAVEAGLRAVLAGGWKFTASGKGASEPVAEEKKADGSDDPDGRARNRRVEVTYGLKPAATGSASAGGTATKATGSAGTPAAFRTGDGTVVAERDATSDSPYDSAGPVKFHLKVHPFYRDGGYLVAVFEVANLSGQKLDPSWGYFRSTVYPGPTFAPFSVVDPATGAAYRPAYVTVERVKDYLDGHLYGPDAAQPQRAYMYVPAPPAGVTSVSFDAGPFGNIENVPVG